MGSPSQHDINGHGAGRAARNSRREVAGVAGASAVTEDFGKDASKWPRPAPQERVTIGIVVPMAMFAALGYSVCLSYASYKSLRTEAPFGHVSALTPLLATSTYVLFVMFGPRVLAHRPPMRLKNWMVAYNLYQTLFNAWACYGFLSALSDLGLSFWGNHLELSPRFYDMAFWVWAHYTNKYLELLDTTFMILRKKGSQVSFLHVYHHCLLIWVWWAGVPYAGGGDMYFGALANSFIHVLMYSYYGLALLRVPCPWKRYLTVLQMLQFAVCGTHTIYGIMVDLGYPLYLCLLELWVMANMLVLFYHFYVQRYSLRQGNGKSTKDGGHATETKWQPKAGHGDDTKMVTEVRAALSFLSRTGRWNEVGALAAVTAAAAAWLLQR